MMIREIMTSDPITPGPENTLIEAGASMKEHRIRHIPIVNGNAEMITYESGEIIIMKNILENKGVLQVVLDEYEKHKLPHIVQIKERLDKGDLLGDEELVFLKKLYDEIYGYESFIVDNPEFKTLYVNFVSIYCSIMDLALENERR